MRLAIFFAVLFLASATINMGQNAYPQSVSIVADINPFPGDDSYPRNLFVYENVLYFGADDGVHGNELWKWDGQSAVMVDDLVEGITWSQPDDFIAYKDALYFTAFHDSTYFARDLWKLQNGQLTRLSDPQDVNLKVEGFGKHFSIVDDRLILSGRKDTIIPIDVEPTDSTNVGVGGSILVGGNPLVSNLIVTERELWEWNGSEVVQITEIYDQFATHPFSGPSINSLHNFNNLLHFTVSGEMWAWDGDDTSPVEELKSIRLPRELATIGGNLLFRGDEDATGEEIYIWNGTDTLKILDLNPGSESSYPRDFTEFRNDIYFAASDGVHGHELWKWDGVDIELVADIYPGRKSSDVKFMTVFDDALFFAASDGVHGHELWKWDGTQATMVSNVESVNTRYGPLNHLTVYNNALYFSHTDAEHGTELWRYVPIPEPKGMFIAMIGVIFFSARGLRRFT